MPPRLFSWKRLFRYSFRRYKTLLRLCANQIVENDLVGATFSAAYDGIIISIRRCIFLDGQNIEKCIFLDSQNDEKCIFSDFRLLDLCL